MKSTKLHLLAFGLLGSTFLSAQVNITLQPNGLNGKDAELFSCINCGYSTMNFGNFADLNAISWTNSGEDSYVRSLIEFDLSVIPQFAIISQASLSLYFNPTSSEGEHSSLSGSNESVLRRVTSMWDENTVTWNTQPSTTTINEVILAQSVSPTQDYINIDVTALVQDMIDNPSAGYGFQLKSVTESPYRRLVFASSDHADPNLHPKLDIAYFDVTSATAISSLQESFLVYPNPANNILTIESNAKVIESIEIVNNVGQKLMTIASPSKIEMIDVSGYSEGVVFVRLHSKEGISTEKVVLLK